MDWVPGLEHNPVERLKNRIDYPPETHPCRLNTDVDRLMLAGGVPTASGVLSSKDRTILPPESDHYSYSTLNLKLRNGTFAG